MSERSAGGKPARDGEPAPGGEPEAGLSFLESIRIEHGRPRRLRLHWERMCSTLHAHGLEPWSFSDLEEAIEAVLDGGEGSSKAACSRDARDAGSPVSAVRGPGRFKLRLLYGPDMWRATLERYRVGGVLGAAVVPASQIRYTHKYADRSELNAAQLRLGPRALAIYEQDGLLTDSWYANVLLRYRGEWYTPEKPLLPGVMRRSLLEGRGFGRVERTQVHACEIPAADLWRFESISFINAMLDPGEMALDTDAVIRLL